MSIPEKLIAISKNQLKIYNAGQLAILDDSEYMHPTVSGSVIAVNDFSDINQNLNIKLKSDTITDFSNVAVSRLGKNLLPYPYVGTSSPNGITFTDNGDGSITANGTATSVTYYQFVPMNSAFPLPKGEYIISGSPLGSNYSNTYCISGMITKDGVNTAFAVTDSSPSAKISVTDDNTVWRCMIVIRSGVKVDNIVFKPQLEIGSVATEYEPYIKPQTVTVDNADGTVEGLTSLSSNMTLVTDTDGVNISCEYYRDIDAYINNLMMNVALTGGV